MTNPGDAAIAMWWTVADADRAEFHEWHSKEHLPERMRIPGFRRGSRWEAIDGAGGMFVTYELESYAVLTSEGYYSRLNKPTPWSVKMMPLHRNMVRSQCRVLASAGAGIAAYLSTLCLSPRPGQEEALSSHIRSRLGALPDRKGISAARLLRTETPSAQQTVEQQIRGEDGAADWILLISGYDRDAITTALVADFADEHLESAGGTRTGQAASYRLVHAMTPQDL